VRLLRRWKPDGICDVVLDRPRNLVFGRLDRKNRLDIREVSFVIELYVMLAGGQKANLSVCRITQRKGAASSFKMVAEAIEHEMNKKDFLVKDEEMKKEMESVLTNV
jgi:serine/threonine-protein kinase HSL1 (negative regulator of Swe1 kinase)